MVDVAQNESNQAKAQFPNDENVLNQALLEQSQVEQSIRESELPCNPANAGSDTVAQVGTTFNWLKRVPDRFESGHHPTKEAKLAAQNESCDNGRIQLSRRHEGIYLAQLTTAAEAAAGVL